MSVRSTWLPLAAAVLPLAAVLSDLLASIQGEAVWTYASAVALGLGLLAVLWTTWGRSQVVPAVAASTCMAASLTLRVAPLAPPDLTPVLAAWLLALGVALLLFSGALVNGLDRAESTPEAAMGGLLEDPVKERRAA